MYKLNNLTSFKNTENPSCIDLVLTNCSRRFQKCNVLETGLPDFHKLTVAVLKQYFPKQNSEGL